MTSEAPLRHAKGNLKSTGTVTYQEAGRTMAVRISTEIKKKITFYSKTYNLESGYRRFGDT
jgi:hypothetical protein